MKRHTRTSRSNWQRSADELGFTYYATEQNPDYGTVWNESVAYEFTSTEIDVLEAATEELHQRCLETVDHVINDADLLHKLGIHSSWHNYLQSSWYDQHPSIYGRFDLAYNGIDPPKMLEYNADTPTMLLETSLMQWKWLQDEKPTCDQFNSVHEKLLSVFETIKDKMPKNTAMHFAGLEHLGEEFQTCMYLLDLASQAGIESKFIDINQIGYDNRLDKFVDQNCHPINFCFKLYPWEWMMNEDFGQHVLKNKTGWIEPAWKSILSNKGFMPIMSQLFPNHPNILHSTFTADEQPSGNYVAKPFLSREGQNILWYENNVLAKQMPGVYTGAVMYQETAKLFCQDGNFAVIGSWVIGNQSAGIIVRDHNDSIIHDRSSVVPHWFE